MWPSVTSGSRGWPGADASSPCPCPIPWIRISQAQLSDAGRYTCVVSSRAGVADRSFVLQIQGTGQGAGEGRAGTPRHWFCWQSTRRALPIPKQDPEPFLLGWAWKGWSKAGPV